MYFSNYGLHVLRKCLKGLVSEDFPTSNMLNGLKHSLYAHKSTFNIFIDQYE